MWTLSSISVYPVKSLDPVCVDQAALLPSGALTGDRQFALFDESGKVINGKQYPAIHQIRAEFDLAEQSVQLSVPQQSIKSVRFPLVASQPELESWFSDYFQTRVHIQENRETGFPDDLAASGPTIISTQTYEELARWFPEISIEELRLRFRANLEFTGDLPFCEDRLYAAEEPSVQFQIGTVTFTGSNPCKRCVVPSRSPWSGDTDPQFMKTFIRKRQETFPAWGDRSLFQNMYRLAVNTRLAGTENDVSLRLHVGDPLKILK
ncbi:MOSC domain-containing protein [Gimesia sp.]|uniref:MOSC domain-containing protein n=1 Tax=Gimesia sp. TaxID=2024833 RepID=UPI003A8CC279